MSTKSFVGKSGVPLARGSVNFEICCWFCACSSHFVRTCDSQTVENTAANKNQRETASNFWFVYSACAFKSRSTEVQGKRAASDTAGHRPTALRLTTRAASSKAGQTANLLLWSEHLALSPKRYHQMPPSLLERWFKIFYTMPLEMKYSWEYFMQNKNA